MITQHLHRQQLGADRVSLGSVYENCPYGYKEEAQNQVLFYCEEGYFNDKATSIIENIIQLQF